MKDFFIVLRFELMNFFKNKTFIISTIIICLLLGIGLSIPTIKDKFFTSKVEQEEDIVDTTPGTDIFGYIDLNNSISNKEDLMEGFFQNNLIEVSSVEEMEERISSGEFTAGYIIESPIKYKYMVENNEMYSTWSYLFEDSLERVYRIEEFRKRGIEYKEVEDLIHVNIEGETVVLGKDSVNNYLYTYILVFGLYFLIMLYGQLVATSVASEKSNRAMEVLITSTKSTNLIFGKVIGGALAGVFQFGMVILVATVSYRFNAAAWDNSLDFIFKIPATVLLTFSIFGILGYLFYSFIYGALGALVSRTEDISASATPITIVFIGVFMIAVIGMQNTEGLILKIASFIPFSSFMAMFVRVSMGTVSTMEVIISLIILALSTVAIGLIGSMIYRMGTLMYGNPVKIKNALKLLRDNKE